MAWICTQWHSAILLAVDVAALNMIGKWRCIIKFCWCFIVTTRWSVHWWPATTLIYLCRCRKDSRTSFWSHTVWLQHIYVFMFAVFLRANSVLWCFFWLGKMKMQHLKKVWKAKDWKNCFTKQKNWNNLS